MSLPVIVIRPEPGCTQTVDSGAAIGLDMLGCPLFEIVSRAWSVPADKTDGLLIGSANALRYGGPGLEALRTLPVLAVGEATAAAARAAGFTVERTGAGGLQALVDGLAGPRHLLRLAGEEHVPLRLPPGVVIETRVVYAGEPRSMPSTLADRLGTGAVVLLHSGVAAKHFAAECARLGISRAQIRLAALAPRIAALAGEGWGEVVAAAQPSDGALLALAADLCHVRPSGKGR